MEYRRCQPACARFIASDDPHIKCVKCLVFSHAREAVYGISKCTFCENLRLRTLRSRLERTCFHVPLRSSLWIGPMSPASLKHRNSTSGSLAALIPGLKGGSCRFSAICIRRSPDPGSSHFPPALPMRQPLTSPTLWILWSRATLQFLWSRTL